MNPNHQDWNTVVISKRPQSGGAKKPQNLAAAQRAGAQINTEKKYGAGGNARSGTGLNMAKLDAETEELKHNTVDKAMSKKIQQARLAKKMTQAQLAQAINEQPKTITEYENGKAIPNQQVLSKMERALGAKLRGK